MQVLVADDDPVFRALVQPLLQEWHFDVVMAGADGYLIKPFEPLDLKVRLRNAVRALRLQGDLDDLLTHRLPFFQPTARHPNCWRLASFGRCLSKVSYPGSR